VFIVAVERELVAGSDAFCGRGGMVPGGASPA
jgi:hypothetical protein